MTTIRIVALLLSRETGGDQGVDPDPVLVVALSVASDRFRR
jgi:hypothetical protein